MKYIEMTVEQTAIYDGANESAQSALISELRERAQAIREGGETVEIYTCDGIFADVVQD